jgi:glycosyltransferase involved in cell wall biosynthesis
MLMPSIFRRAARILTVAQCEKRAMLEYYPATESRLRVIQNGCMAPETALMLASECPSLPIQAPYLLYVGSLSRRKNVQGVIAASEILFEDFPDLTTVLVGGGTKVFHSREFSIPEVIRERFIFRGQVNDTAEICGIYRRAACFVFPSYYEASPLPPMEAMAAGCPVVASAIPSHHERLGDAALFCDPDDPSDIARKIATVLLDDGIAHGLRMRGVKRAGEFTWQRCAMETLRAIDDVVIKTSTVTRRVA